MNDDSLFELLNFQCLRIETEETVVGISAKELHPFEWGRGGLGELTLKSCNFMLICMVLYINVIHLNQNLESGKEDWRSFKVRPGLLCLW